MLYRQRQVNRSKSTDQQDRRIMNFTGDRSNQQKFLIVGDRSYQHQDESILQIVSFLEKIYTPASIVTVKDSATAQVFIRETNLNLIIIFLNIARWKSSNTPTSADLKLIEKLLASKWCPNILILGKNIDLSRHQTAIKNYSGGFVVLNSQSCQSLFLPDLIRYIDLAMKGLTYLPQTIKSTLELHPNWVRMLHLRFEYGFKDRAIARMMGISDRTVRNYWVQIQDTLLIDDDPNKDIKVLVGIEARRIGLIS